MKEILTGTPWINISGFQYGSLQGYRDGVFGYILAGEFVPEHIYHEIGHAIEFVLAGKPEAITFERFNFHVPQVFIMGDYYSEPVTTNGIERELRTMAIQARILEENPLIEFDLEDFIEQSARSMWFMDDYLNIGLLHLTDKGTMTHDEKNLAKKQWCKDYLLDAFKHIDMQAVKDAWPVAIERIKSLSLDIEKTDRHAVSP